MSQGQQGVAEGFFDRFRKKQQNYGGIDVSVEKEDNNILVKATANGRELGRVLFTPSEQDDNLLVPLDLEVDERYRGQGIGTTMYDYVKSLGYTIRRSQYQTDAGAGFWDKHKSGKNVWEQGIAKDDSPRIKLGGDSSAAKAWIERVHAKYPYTMQNNHVMVWGKGDDQQFAMFELTPSFSKRGAVEVKWIQAYPLRQGVGSRAMQELQAMAREDGISLTLFPWDKGQVSQSKLTKFYRGQGFTPTVKGSKSMQWEPK
jgi:GNAT superfamily N-acetyltransferase